jgi:2-amino-4-hydroxy-6-hydroxymethyldihydropteridine diphosphokinase
MAEAFVALGSNIGDRAANLAGARAALDGGPLKFTALSSVYETEPWGPVAQGPYLNQVVRGTTELMPRVLLSALFAIETKLGRDRQQEIRFGPRVIDLDVLLYGDLAISEADLEIPHPRLLERAFVLVPLAEIAPDRMVNGIKVRDALARLGSKGITLFAAPDAKP